jgi:2-polyprenyl-3-methyl-5-hydroxy-6-metoxy-1,4-benzoquinol methylase
MEKSAKGTHEEVFRLLKNEKKGVVLDAPAGEGAFSKKLVDLGFEVIASDIDPTNFKYKNLRCQKVDLNKDLPYETSSFDFVVCIEGIEHLENPWHTIREFSRILKNEGKLIITTPNVLHLLSRFVYYAKGELLYFSEIDFKTGHINPISFTELKTILEKNNFKIEEITNNRYASPIHTYIFLNLVRKMLFLILSLYNILYRQKNERPRELLDNSISRGQILIIKAMKI